MTKLAKRSETLPAKVLADRVVARLMEAEKALHQATTIHQAKLVADVASAQEVFAHRQRLGEEVIGYAHQIKIYALGKLGLGTDLLVFCRKKIQVKCDYCGGERPEGTGNLFLQKAERNPLRMK